MKMFLMKTLGSFFGFAQYLHYEVKVPDYPDRVTQQHKAMERDQNMETIFRFLKKDLFSNGL